MRRTAVAVFNELSALENVEDAQERDVEVLIETFVLTLRAARDVRPGLAVVSERALPKVEVTPGITMAAFLERRGGRGKDLQRFVLMLQNHAPFSKAPGVTLAAEGEEYRHEGRAASGLGVAALNHWISTSLATAQWSEASEVQVERLWLEEDSSIGSEVLAVPHMADPEHVAQHADFLRAMTLASMASGAEIWRDRQVLYPSLRFLPRVEQQLEALPAGSAALRQVSKRLGELQEAAGAWNPSEKPMPAWGSLVTSEGEQRKRLCHFQDVDGATQCFDLHARFTPGPGRIHFRLDAGVAQLVVAHVGRKLG